MPKHILDSDDFASCEFEPNIGFDGEYRVTLIPVDNAEIAQILEPAGALLGLDVRACSSSKETLSSTDPTGDSPGIPTRVTNGAMGYVHKIHINGVQALGSYGKIRPGTVHIIKLNEDGQLVDSADIQGFDSKDILPAVEGYGSFEDADDPASAVILGKEDNFTYKSWIQYETGDAIIYFADTVNGIIGENEKVQLAYKTYQSLPTLLGGVYIKGDVVFPNWEASGLVELFGFEANEEHGVLSNIDIFGKETPVLDANGSMIFTTEIGYQISTDGGTTWKYYDSSGGWLQGSDADETFSTADKIDAGISTLTFTKESNKKQLRIKARLFPSEDNQQTPRITSLQLNYEHVFDPEEDFKRTLKRYIETNLNVRDIQQFVAQVNTSQFTLNTTTGEETLTYINNTAYPMQIYNLTLDPGRTTLLDATLEDGVITTDLTILAGEKIEVQIFSTVPTFITADERFELSTTRAALIENISIKSQMDWDLGPKGKFVDIEKETSKSVARLRDWGQYLVCKATLIVQSSNERQALSMAAALRRLFTEGYNLTSLATGEKYVLISRDSIDEFDDITASLYTKKLDVIFAFYASESSYNIAYLVRRVAMISGLSSTGAFEIEEISSEDLMK